MPFQSFSHSLGGVGEKRRTPLHKSNLKFFKNPVLTLAASQRFNPPYFGVPEQSGRQGERGKGGPEFGEKANSKGRSDHAESWLPEQRAAEAVL